MKNLYLIQFSLLCTILSYIDAIDKQFHNHYFQKRVHGIVQPTQKGIVYRWSAIKGSQVNLNCSIKLPENVQLETVHYRWEHPDGFVIGENQFYSIDNVQLDNSGLYICCATAHVGSKGEQWTKRQTIFLEICK